MNIIKDNVSLKKKYEFPSTSTLLVGLIIVSAILTYIVPAGIFDRVKDVVTGRTIIVADSFKYINQTPVVPWKLLQTIYHGIKKASSIIALIFVTGGAFSIILKSGAFDAGLAKIIDRVKGKEYIFIIVTMLAFAFGGASFAMAESTLPFVAIIIGAAISLGYDPIVGVSCILIGAYTGYSASPINPYSVGIAHGICQLPLFSGFGLRMVLLIGALIISIEHTLRYARRVKSDPSKSYVADLDYKASYYNLAKGKEIEFTGEHKKILIILGFMLIWLIFGVIKFKWYFAEICGIFTFMGFLVGLIAFKGNLNKIVNQFMEGAKSLTIAALIVGLSRGVLVVLEDGHIMDTIVRACAIPLNGLPSSIVGVGMYFVQIVINLFIPSSSGQAVVVMPIFSPLADLLNVTRQTAVLAFQAGDGFGNIIVPTHVIVMATIGIAGVPFNKWLKFAFPLFIKWSIWVVIILTYATMTKWGPF